MPCVRACVYVCVCVCVCVCVTVTVCVCVCTVSQLRSVEGIDPLQTPLPANGPPGLGPPRLGPPVPCLSLALASPLQL